MGDLTYEPMSTTTNNRFSQTKNVLMIAGCTIKLFGSYKIDLPTPIFFTYEVAIPYSSGLSSRAADPWFHNFTDLPYCSFCIKSRSTRLSDIG
jgi:hypothetical protein